MNRWTGLFVNINGVMKKIGNVNPSTRDVSLYSDGHQYYEIETLYYVDNHGLYQVL